MTTHFRLLALTLLFGALIVHSASAQIPRTISFQGVLADASGQLVPDGPQAITVSIYDQIASTTPLFSETINVVVARGVFNAIIGGATGIPATVPFDAPYFLGVKIGAGVELAPRTPFTAVPYSLNAAVAQHAITADHADTADVTMFADSAGNLRGGVVTHVNGQQGVVDIIGAGATTITRNGSQIIIRSTDTSSGGIRRIDNFDGSLVIDPPQGPFVTMFIREGGVQTHHIRDNSITNAKMTAGSISTGNLQDGAVTNPKLAPNAVTTDKILDGTIINQDYANNSINAAKITTEGAAMGFALMSNGTNTPIWANPIDGNIPFAGTFNSPLTLWSLTQTGTGGNGNFVINNAANTTNALIGTTNGTGNGVFGAHTATTGTAGGVRGESNSTDANATGVVGVINSTSPGGFSAGVRGINNGTGGLGIGVYGSQNGSGWGAYGTAPSGIGVHGNSSSGFGMYGLSSTGTGVFGTSTTGTSGAFLNTNAANGSPTLTTNTNGIGDAFVAATTGAGRAANLSISNAANSANAVDVSTNGTGRALRGTRGAGSGISLGQTEAIRGDNTDGPGVAGTANTAVGVYGTSLATHGVWGVSVTTATAGVLGRNDVAGGFGVWGQSFGGGTGVNGTSQTGHAGNFEITNAASTGDAIRASQMGLGRGVYSNINNTSNIVAAVRGETNGGGYGIFGQATGNGNAGFFQVSNPASTSSVMNVTTNGIGSGITVQLTNASNGARGIDVMQSGVGPGVFATSAGGNAVWGITSSISAAGVIGDNTFGEAVVGRNRGGNGVGAVVGRNDSSGYGVRGFNTKDGIGVLGQAGISGGTGVGGRFENVNAANGNDALQASTNGTGWAGNFTNANNSSASRGVRISTTAGQGGNALRVNNGTVSMSYQHPYASNTVVDDAYLVVTTAGNVTVPTGPPLVDGATVWVVNNAGAGITVTNTTIGGLVINNGEAAQLLFVSTVSGANWIPVQ